MIISKTKKVSNEAVGVIEDPRLRPKKNKKEFWIDMHKITISKSSVLFYKEDSMHTPKKNSKLNNVCAIVSIK